MGVSSIKVKLRGLCETICKELSQSKKTEEQTTDPWKRVLLKEWLKKDVQKNNEKE